MRVFGTIFVSTTRIHGVHLMAEKYSAAALISSSVMALAKSIIVFVFGFRGSAVCRTPLRKSWSWRTKYATGRPDGRGVLRPSLAVRQVARGAAARVLAKLGRTVRDHIRHRRVIAGEPVDDVLAVAHVDQ